MNTKSSIGSRFNAEFAMSSLLLYSTAFLCYELKFFNTSFGMNKWTQLQTNSLWGTFFLSCTSPWLRTPLHNKLGEKLSNLIFNLTPLFAIGMTTYHATNLKKESFLVGAYFSTIHKIIDYWAQYRSKVSLFDPWSRISSWEILERSEAPLDDGSHYEKHFENKKYYIPYPIPTNYYEELAFCEYYPEKARERGIIKV